MKKILMFLFLLFCTPAFAQTYTVERVIDGDTLKLTNGETVRLLGIDCAENEYSPEEATYLNMGKKWERGPGEEEQAKQSMEYLKNYIKQKVYQKKTVKLEYDVEGRDKYERTLAYVYLRDYIPPSIEISFVPIDGVVYLVEEEGKIYIETFVNAYMVYSGYAQPMTIPPNVKYADLFQKLHEEARAQKRGFWSEPADLELPDYDVLARACKGSGCCLSSVKRMKEGGYGLAPGKTLAESGCPEGTKPDMLKCIDSYRWCVPE